jgi:hypothetical protein
MRAITEVLLVVMTCTAVAMAQVVQINMDEVQKVSVTFLPAFRALITDKNYRAMGFESPAEAGEVKLGVPLRVFMVELSRLQRFHAGDNPDGLMTPLDRVIYPVAVNDQTRSSMVISKGKEGWELAELGSSEPVKSLTRLRRGNADSTGLPLGSFFAVMIPALNLEFLGYNVNTTTMLIPLFDDATYGFRSGFPVPAAKVFDAVLPAAKGHNGLPR